MRLIDTQSEFAGQNQTKGCDKGYKNPEKGAIGLLGCLLFILLHEILTVCGKIKVGLTTLAGHTQGAQIVLVVVLVLVLENYR